MKENVNFDKFFIFTQVDENHHLASDGPVHLSTVPASTQGTSRSGRGAAQTPSGPSDSGAPQEQQEAQILGPPAPVRRNMEEDLSQPEDGGDQEEEEQEQEEESAGGQNLTEVSEASDQHPPPSEEPEPEQGRPQPNMVEPLLDHRGKREFSTCSLVT